MMICMAGSTSVLVLALWIPASGNAATTVFTALFGIASGAGIGLTPVLIGHISPIQQIGTRTGTCYSIAAVAALTGSPIGGAILAAKGDGPFQNTKIFAGVSCALGALFFIASNVALGGWKRNQKGG
ncbi:hypothetical protein MFIFM68171_05843 [Madurella fahalii]|uniref:Major facilitator superfamily (MFS) profile domain-containing protein n=1 Tax=Madurella fahalii TaxID=1157608 RepID=A0ABQ0GCY3_9PEZI